MPKDDEKFTREHYRRKAVTHAERAETALDTMPPGSHYSDAHAKRAAVANAHATLALYFDRIANG